SVDTGGEEVAGAEVAGDVPYGRRSGPACGGGMAAAAVARGRKTTPNRRGAGLAPPPGAARRAGGLPRRGPSAGPGAPVPDPVRLGAGGRAAGPRAPLVRQ